MSNVVKAKAPNYSDAETAQLIADYNGGNGMSVAEIAAKMNRTPKSVQGKLVFLKVYVPAVKAVKTFADQGPAKKELTKALEQYLSPECVTGLNNATKSALAELVERFKDLNASATAENVDQVAEAA